LFINRIQSLSKVKNKIDNITKNIYSSLQESYKEAAAIEAKYKGEGTAEYYKQQHITVPPPLLLEPHSGPGSPHKGARKLRPFMASNTDGLPMVEGIASTNRILLNKCAKPN